MFQVEHIFGLDIGAGAVTLGRDEGNYRRFPILIAMGRRDFDASVRSPYYGVI